MRDEERGGETIAVSDASWSSSWSHLGIPNLFQTMPHQIRLVEGTLDPNGSKTTLIPKPLRSTKGEPWPNGLSGKNLRSHEPGEALAEEQ